MENVLPAGIGIEKGPFCDGCRTFKPFVKGGETVLGIGGQLYATPQIISCENYIYCDRAYYLGRKEAEKPIATDKNIGSKNGGAE